MDNPHQKNLEVLWAKKAAEFLDGPAAAEVPVKDVAMAILLYAAAPDVSSEKVSNFLQRWQESIRLDEAEKLKTAIHRHLNQPTK